MKKLLFVFAIVGLLAFTSCSKEKTCSCDYFGTVTEEVADDCDDLESTKIAGISVPNGKVCTEK